MKPPPANAELGRPGVGNGVALGGLGNRSVKSGFESGDQGEPGKPVPEHSHRLGVRRIVRRRDVGKGFHLGCKTGIFRRDLLLRIGGFRADAVGEDFDLIVRLHRYLCDREVPYHINFIPDPTCWTEAPSDYKSLARQRARWHKGLIDTLWSARDMLFQRRYGRVGWIILPYMWLFECFSPVLELLGYGTIILAAVLGALSQHFFVQFLLFGYAFATLISVGSVLLEEMNYRRYSNWLEVAWLLIYCLFEHLPYRQMTMCWRLRGIWEYLRGDLSWHQVKRTGASASV